MSQSLAVNILSTCFHIKNLEILVFLKIQIILLLEIKTSLYQIAIDAHAVVLGKPVFSQRKYLLQRKLKKEIIHNKARSQIRLLKGIEFL